MTRALALQEISTRAGLVRYVRTGEGPPLVLLHGNGHAWHEFEPVIGRLATAFDVIAWDMPGQGASADAPAATGIEDYAGALEDLIDGLGLVRPALAGSSVGALIAAAYAARRRDVSALVLAEAQFRTRDWWNAAWPIVQRMFGEPIQSRQEIEQRFCSPVSDELIGRWNHDRARVGAAGLIGVMGAIRDFDFAAALARTPAPTLLLFGAQGPTVEMAQAMAEATPGAALQIVEGAGHFVSIDQSTAFASSVLDFLLRARNATGAMIR